VDGVINRQIDYQIWCGPSMGAFNEWTAGTFLEKPENRDTATVAMNLLYGAAVATRIGTLNRSGVALPAEVTRVPPLPLDQIRQAMEMDVES
jgi:hypothetical protein